MGKQRKGKDDWIDSGWHQYEGLKIRYGVRRGVARGVPLLIFNGVGQSNEVLQPLIEAMEGIEVITLDVPGTG